VAIFIRTDAPVAPGTATPSTSTLTIPITAGGYIVTLYGTSVALDPGEERTVISVPISPTKRSLVVAVFNCFGTSRATLRIYIGDVLVAEQPMFVDKRQMLTIYGYGVVLPGNYYVYVRAYNSTSQIGYVTWWAEDIDLPGGSLVVYVVPLE
jgi:hypothetical protein